MMSLPGEKVLQMKKYDFHKWLWVPFLKKKYLARFGQATAKNIILDIHFLKYLHDGLTWETSFVNEKVTFPQMTMGAFSEIKLIWHDLTELQPKT